MGPKPLLIGLGAALIVGIGAIVAILGLNLASGLSVA